jgi:hypothetical protein
MDITPPRNRNNRDFVAPPLRRTRRRSINNNNNINNNDDNSTELEEEGGLNQLRRLATYLETYAHRLRHRSTNRFSNPTAYDPVTGLPRLDDMNSYLRADTTPPRNRNNRDFVAPPLRRTRRRSINNNINRNGDFLSRLEQENIAEGQPQIQARVANIPSLNARINNHNRTIKERTIAYLLQKSQIKLKEPKVISSENKIEVYDFIEAETIEVNPFNLSEDNIVFKANNSYFQYQKSLFQEHLTNVENIIFECKTRKIGAPRVEDVVEENPYYLLRGSANFLIPLGDMRMLLESPFNVFEIKKTSKHLVHTTGLESIISKPPHGLLGQEVDITSADHCQAGTERDVYELIPIVFEEKNGGGGVFSKKKNNNKTFSKRNPFSVNTLTGNKKNIEKRRKSMKKVKKIFGVNNK